MSVVPQTTPHEKHLNHSSVESISVLGSTYITNISSLNRKRRLLDAALNVSKVLKSNQDASHAGTSSSPRSGKNKKEKLNGQHLVQPEGRLAALLRRFLDEQESLLLSHQNELRSWLRKEMKRADEYECGATGENTGAKSVSTHKLNDFRAAHLTPFMLFYREWLASVANVHTQTIFTQNTIQTFASDLESHNTIATDKSPALLQNTPVATDRNTQIAQAMRAWRNSDPSVHKAFRKKSVQEKRVWLNQQVLQHESSDADSDLDQDQDA
jgi:hypothetical protein